MSGLAADLSGWLMLPRLFASVLNMSISATLAAGVLLLLRLPFGKRLPVSFTYLLWGVVVFRLLVPVSLPAVVSVFNLTGGPVSPSSGGALVSMEFVRYDPAASAWQAQTFDWSALLPVAARVWLVGAAAVLLWRTLAGWRFRYKMRFACLVREDAVLEDCRRRVGVRRPVRVESAPGLNTAVTCGVLRPRIYLPRRSQPWTDSQLVHIYTHELVHIRRLDVVFRLLFQLACAVHWFNPFVWFCCRILTQELERSCDEAVLSVLGEGEKAGYAQTLLEVSAQQADWGGYLGFGETALKSRIYGIIRFHKMGRVQTALLMLAVLALGVSITTNPVPSDGFYLQRYPVSQQAGDDFRGLAEELAWVLDNQNPIELLSLTQDPDVALLPLYQWVEDQPVLVRSWKLYPQSEELAYCDLEGVTLGGGKLRLMATFRRSDEDGIWLAGLEGKGDFQSRMSLAEEHDPAAQLVESLHRYGLVTGLEEEGQLPESQVAAFCVEQCYLQRVKQGGDPSDTAIPQEEVRQAAKLFFGLEDFRYDFDPDLFDAQSGCYRYDPSWASPVHSAVLETRSGQDATQVTARIYQDPLHASVSMTVTYTLSDLPQEWDNGEGEAR